MLWRCLVMATRSCCLCCVNPWLCRIGHLGTAALGVLCSCSSTACALQQHHPWSRLWHDGCMGAPQRLLNIRCIEHSLFCIELVTWQPASARACWSESRQLASLLRYYCIAVDVPKVPRSHLSRHHDPSASIRSHSPLLYPREPLGAPRCGSVRTALC